MLLLVEGELHRGKGKIPEESGLVAIEESRESLLSNDLAERIGCGAIIISGIEVWVVVPSLEL